MMLIDRWRDLVRDRRWLTVGSLAVVAATGSVILLTGPDDVDVGTGDTQTSTTADAPVPSTDGSTATTTPPPTTLTPITTAPPTSSAPPSTTVAPALTTAPPLPPTTAPLAPPEFAATVRGTDQGPDHYAIFFGTTYGGGGGFHVYAACRPGTLRITILDDGMVDGEPPNRPLTLRVIVDDEFTPGSYIGDPGTTVWDQKPVTDGTVITAPVQSRVRIMVPGPSHHDIRIRYDCRG